MMEILIIYETIEGQTGKIADFIADFVIDAGHTVREFDTEDRFGSLSFEGSDAIVLVAPVHERRHPKNFEVLVSTSLKELGARKTLLLSVSLKAAFPEGLDEANDYLTEMKMRTGFTPDQQALVAGAVRTSGYGYFESQIVKHVVLAGRDVTLKDGIREFTDWGALENDLETFLEVAT